MHIFLSNDLYKFVLIFFQKIRFTYIIEREIIKKCHNIFYLLLFNNYSKLWKYTYVGILPICYLPYQSLNQSRYNIFEIFYCDSETENNRNVTKKFYSKENRVL